MKTPPRIRTRPSSSSSPSSVPRCPPRRRPGAAAAAPAFLLLAVVAAAVVVVVPPFHCYASAFQPERRVTLTVPPSFRLVAPPGGNSAAARSPLFVSSSSAASLGDSAGGSAVARPPAPSKATGVGGLRKGGFRAAVVKALMMTYIASMCVALPATLLPVYLLYRLKLITRLRKETLSLEVGQFCSRFLLRLLPFASIDLHPLCEENPEPSVWVCNHVSMLDVFFLLAADRRLRGRNKRPIKIVYWKGLESNPVTRLLFTMCGFVSVDMADNGNGNANEYDRSTFRKLLTDVKNAFEEGFDVGILPEGQPNPAPELGLQPIYTGAFTLARMSKRPVRMMALHGLHNLWHPTRGMDVRGRNVGMRVYPPCGGKDGDGRFENAEEFSRTFTTVVGHFGATGRDLPKGELDDWLSGEAWGKIKKRREEEEERKAAEEEEARPAAEAAAASVVDVTEAEAEANAAALPSQEAETGQPEKVAAAEADKDRGRTGGGGDVDLERFIADLTRSTDAKVDALVSDAEGEVRDFRQALYGPTWSESATNGEKDEERRETPVERRWSVGAEAKAAEAKGAPAEGAPTAAAAVGASAVACKVDATESEAAAYAAELPTPESERTLILASAAAAAGDAAVAVDSDIEDDSHRPSAEEYALLARQAGERRAAEARRRFDDAFSRPVSIPVFASRDVMSTLTGNEALAAKEAGKRRALDAKRRFESVMGGMNGDSEAVANGDRAALTTAANGETTAAEGGAVEASAAGPTATADVAAVPEPAVVEEEEARLGAEVAATSEIHGAEAKAGAAALPAREAEPASVAPSAVAGADDGRSPAEEYALLAERAGERRAAEARQRFDEAFSRGPLAAPIFAGRDIMSTLTGKEALAAKEAGRRRAEECKRRFEAVMERVNGISEGGANGDEAASTEAVNGETELAAAKAAATTDGDAAGAAAGPTTAANDAAPEPAVAA